MENKYIQKMLCLSTVHVTPSTFERIINDDFAMISCYPKEGQAIGEVYGAIIYVVGVSREPENEFLKDVSEDLRDVLLYAVDNDAQWLMFDHVYDEISDLKMYRKEWDDFHKGIA